MAVPTALRRAAVVLLVAGAAAALSFRAVYEPDLWYHLAQGRENLAGHIVRENTFSFNYPDYRQHYAPWLFDAGMYAAWAISGGAGVQTIQAIFLAAAFWLVYLAARQHGPAVAAFAVLLIGIGIIEPRAIPRPHLASFAALAACMVIIEKAVAKGRASPLWWAVPLVAIWSNLHVEAAFGAFVVAVFASVELVRPGALPRREGKLAVGIAVLCAVATFVNPYGVGIWQYLIENRAVTGLLEIAELQPPYLPSYRAFFLYLIVTGVVLVLAPRGIRVWELVIVGLAAVLGLRYLRLTPIVFIVSAPIVARQIGELMTRGLDRRAVVVTAIALAVAGARLPITAYGSSWQVGDAAIEPTAFFSSGAIDFITRGGLRGPVFNSNNLGGYLAFKLYPDVRIFQDSRFQTYPPEHFQRILRASASPQEWQALVAPVDWAVLSRPRPDGLSGVDLFPAAEWGTVFRDDAIEIVVRRSGRSGALARAE